MGNCEIIVINYKRLRYEVLLIALALSTDHVDNDIYFISRIDASAFKASQVNVVRYQDGKGRSI